ncbi:hypothetical protein BY458DRAFT_500153 [Sporodiniella umbellata]|nr:hypothetical protein BY458DRAFT_500153 [Sporodiniella umbellata]
MNNMLVHVLCWLEIQTQWHSNIKECEDICARMADTIELQDKTGFPLIEYRLWAPSLGNANTMLCSKQEESTYAICSCGKILSAGWDCDACRTNCSVCNRALVPLEKCSRCFPLSRL